MGAGIMQLLFFGQQDIYLKSNPSLTFFKKVFKTHTNFSMEPIKIEFNKTDTNIYEKTILKTKIPRHADLVSQIYFVFQIPEIVSSEDLAFRWIENVGECFIDNYYMSIGGQIVDKQYCELSHVLNNLTFSSNKINSFNKMSGNIVQLYNPEEYYNFFVNKSNPPLKYRLASGYPAGIPYDPAHPETYTPSIQTRTLYVPLNFWFNKDIGNALPLVALQYSEIELVIELKPWIQLYKLYYTKNNVIGQYAPDPYVESHQLHNFVSNVKANFLTSDSTINCYCRLEANYIYLDDTERQQFAYKPLDYLIEQTMRIEYSSLGINSTLNLVLQNPLKELIWVLKRSDQAVYNSWFDFFDNNEPIMKTAKILFNGIDRIDEKEAEYFNYLQAFQHHSGEPLEGTYVYSFSIFPEEFQPSGSVNASRINNIQLFLSIKEPSNDNYEYNISIYSINYNFLRISSGLAGIVYSS